MRRASTILIATLLSAPHVSDARPKQKAAKQAKAHTDKAAKAHKAGKFDEALTELQAAYAIDPQPKLLFAIAQVQQKLDQCDEAIPNYEKFLAAEKNKQKQAVVKQAIASCKTKLAAAEPEPPPPEPVEPEPAEPVPAAEPAIQPAVEPTLPPQEPVGEAQPEPAPPRPIAAAPMHESPRPGRSPFYTDALGDVLVVGGIGAAAVSLVLYTGAKSDLDAAENASTIGGYESLVDRAHDKRTYAVVLAGAGAALIGAGILRFALRGESRRVAVTPANGGGFVTFSGGF